MTWHSCLILFWCALFTQKRMHKVSVQQAVPFNLWYTYRTRLQVHNPINQYSQVSILRDGLELPDFANPIKTLEYRKVVFVLIISMFKIVCWIKMTIKINNRNVNVFGKFVIKGVPRVLTSSRLSLKVDGLCTFVHNPYEIYTVRALSYTVRVHLELIQ